MLKNVQCKICIRSERESECSLFRWQSFVNQISAREFICLSSADDMSTLWRSWLTSDDAWKPARTFFSFECCGSWTQKNLSSLSPCRRKHSIWERIRINTRHTAAAESQNLQNLNIVLINLREINSDNRPQRKKETTREWARLRRYQSKSTRTTWTRNNVAQIFPARRRLFFRFEFNEFSRSYRRFQSRSVIYCDF